MVSHFFESSRLLSTDCLEQRLDDYRAVIALPPVDIADPYALNHQELTELRERIAVANFAHYRCAESVNDTAVLAFCRQVGLQTIHPSEATGGLKRIQVSYDSKSRYIPYTNSELNWHTDGYYYPKSNPVRAMLLHCVRPARKGGATKMINHEIVYALLAQRNPEYIAALSQADVMTIPANMQAPDGPREAQSGPVFWQGADRIYMRYTTRRHNILWRQDPLSHEAVEALVELLNQRKDLMFHQQLRAFEGVLSNNTPHRREPFQESTQKNRERLFYRGRFHDSIHIP